MTIHVWYLMIFSTAAVLTQPLMRLAERIGTSAGVVDRPRLGEVQTHVVPRTGGYAVFVAVWAAVLVSFAASAPGVEHLSADNERLVGVFLGSVALLPLAMVDDVRRLGPGAQISWQIVAAAIPTLFGLRMDEIATPFGIVSLPEAAAITLAVVWVVAMINAINLLDTMDGMATGVAGIACLVLFVRTVWFSQASIAVLPLALGGACLSFLQRNWHPSKVILGSSGSLFLGYLLGVITVIGGAKIGTAFLVLAVPILDVAWVMYRRVASGRSPFRGGDGQHLPHRLRVLGLSDRRIVLLVYAVCALIGAAVLAMHSILPTIQKAYLAAVVVAGVSAMLVLVGRATARLGSSPDPTAPITHRREP
ncbi:MAG TPA: MraY family glycosyltransferase [Chloroflexota bacterium]|nr:MraY family glycosyltransferase [Chloroflexota bacterium]